jgi:beta-lactamase regulating signal transducer with metallopeptidase domain
VQLWFETGVHGLAPELGWLAALLTYSLHALLWAGGAALLVRQRRAPFGLRHAVWKLALFAPLVTTCVTLWAPASLAPSFGAAACSPQIVVLSLDDAGANLTGNAQATTPLRICLDVAGNCLLFASALGVVRFAGFAGRRWFELRRRRRVRDLRLRARLRRLVAPLSLGEVRLTESASIECPLVLGRREICVPLPALAALDDDAVDAVLAHELAHLERRDAFWFALCGAVQAALWFHPITRWVCAQLRHSAELACDDRCVELTGQPRALARALTSIAAQTLSAQQTFALPTMAEPRSGLVARVARLTSDANPGGSRGRWQSRTLLGASLTVVAVLSLVSRFRVAEAALPPVPLQPAKASAEISAQITGLARRAQVLEQELAALTARAVAANASSSSVRLMELEQELRHTRQMQAFLEASAADE